MLNDAMSKSLVESKGTITSTMNTAALGQIGINFVVAVGVSQLIGAMNALQIMVFQLMMNLESPANLQFFNGILVGLLNAEVIDPEWSTKLVFDFSLDEDYITK